ncbi:MAG TPA: 4-hydroxy-tetrahydrodipicolinate synthase [Solimonas sp.]|nr:4-hydroxy-tetrahydrodipicolinate synthase [Solimonas sp.]
MSVFEGIWIPLVTPFRQGAVDLKAADRLAAHLAGSGIAGLVVCGTTGEAATLSEAEQEQLLACVQQAVRGRCAVMMGIAGNDTAAVAAAARRYTALAPAGLLVAAPYYVRPSQEGIRRHFEAVAAAAPLPIVIYNIPYRTGVNIEPATCRALAANSQFVAIKESGGGNFNQLSDLLHETPLRVLSGEDHLIFSTVCLGGHGAIAAAAHLYPERYVRMVELLRRGELAAARAIHDGLLPLIRLLFAEPNPAPLKAALAAQGWIGEELRLPMTPVSEACREALRAMLRRMDAAVSVDVGAAAVALG